VKAPARHGTTAKHSSRKHAGTSKHTARTRKAHVRKPASAKSGVGSLAPAPKPRKLTPDGAVALCSARAVAESLRLPLGVVASDDDVLEFYFRTADDPDEGASILATLHAAATYGLAGVRLAAHAQSYGLTERRVAGFGVKEPDQSLLPLGQRSRDLWHVYLGEVDHRVSQGLIHGLTLDRRWGRPAGSAPSDTGAGLILGVDLPGAHTVYATPDGWWSWGELHDPARWPDAVIEEAWAVTWA